MPNLPFGQYGAGRGIPGIAGVAGMIFDLYLAGGAALGLALYLLAALIYPERF